MKNNGLSANRRALIRGLALIPGAAVLASFGSARAAGALPQADAKYQDHPAANGQICAGCSYYIPGKTPSAAGECKLVAGAISPKGWCQLYAPKRA